MIGQIIKAPSGDMVEIKEFKGILIMVYQLNDKNERIQRSYWHGEPKQDLIGIITKEKVKDQLC